MDLPQALTALQALANADRLALVRLLVPLAEGLAAGEIGRRLGLSASRLSFHLAALEAAGLIRARKQARHVIYAVDPGGLGATIAFLLNDCCMDHPEITACCGHGRSHATSPAIRAPGCDAAPPSEAQPPEAPPSEAPPSEADTKAQAEG